MATQTHPKDVVPWKKAALPPGPRGLPVVGVAFDMWRDSLGFLDAARGYGGLYSFKIRTGSGKSLAYGISDPKHVRHVLKDNNENYVKSAAYERLGAVLGDGLLTSGGESWERHRRLAKPAFHKRRLNLLGHTISSTTRDFARTRWGTHDAATVDIASEMSSLALLVVGRALFSTNLEGASAEVSAAVSTFMKHAGRRIKQPMLVPDSWPTPGNIRFRKARRTLDGLVYSIIAQRRSEKEDREDLLSTLISTVDEHTGDGLTDQELRDEVMTGLVAGHETTAMALTWAWYLLSCNAEARHRLLDEVDQELAGRPPSFEDLHRLRYTDRVFRETLRLYPPAWLIPRRAIGEDEIDGYRIPPGARMAISPYVTHRDPALWDNPEGFDPQRFSEQSPERAPNVPFSWYPFGGGPRQCIGRNLALMEGPLILATIAQDYTFDLVPGSRIRPEPSVTLRPQGAIPMNIISRET